MITTLIIDYSPADKVPPIKESFLNKYVILCYSRYNIVDSTLSYAVRNRDKVCFSGVAIKSNTITDPNEIPRIWSTHYNVTSINLLHLMSNKWNTQRGATHIYYIVKDLSDLSIISDMYNLQGSKFLRVLENILRINTL